MRYLSVCSGIEAASAAWGPFGWTPVGFAEIDPFACRLLQHRYPSVYNYGDLTAFLTWNVIEPDLIVGGTPCQAFSVAGLRRGLADPRGNLTLTFLALVERLHPAWVVWENVPGVLTDKTGAFRAFLAGLSQLGYGWAYRVLDAQYFGVPQRRRRVFVVGHSSGQPERAGQVLFEPEVLRRDPPKSRKARKEVTGTLTGRTGGGCVGGGSDLSGGLQVAQAVCSHHDRCDASEDGTGRGTPLVPVVGPLACNAGPRSHDAGQLVIQAYRTSTDGQVYPQGDCAAALTTGTDPAQTVVLGGVSPAQERFGARRLTPTECERLQGFPDDYTNIPGASDSARYRALGNSMAVPVMRALGARIL